jgi:prepilin-type N-terminal cleavage/methylation domain-containing protein
MKSFNLIRKGFTIVELVIVIAVIAILAGVLIPTFSGVIKRANLSADKQAVREMNMALAADEAIHGRPENLEGAMRVLANAGYDADNWVCLTKGYEVYWNIDENRLVLYNASTAEIEYPDNYRQQDLNDPHNYGKYFLYNQHYKQAVEFDTSLGSYEEGSKGSTSASSLASDTASESAKSALSSIDQALSVDTASGSTDNLRDALKLGSNGTAYVYATTEKISGDENSNAYAAMQILSVGSTEDPADAGTLKSDGTLQPNFFYISTVIDKDKATEAEKESAQKAAGTMVFTLFTQMNTSQLTQDINIVLNSGTTIDVSGKEWSPVKEFTGYFGTTDVADPVIIDGATLTSATGFNQTVSFTGSGSQYFVTGFFGTIYGNCTIENVTFRNMKFIEPAMDYEIGNLKIDGKNADNRNTIGIIGGITTGLGNEACEITLSNIKVESSVEMDCGASGAGLIGYIGASSGDKNLTGNIYIDNCVVSAYIHTDYVNHKGSGATDYGVIGGLIGFVCRAKGINIAINNSTFDGKLEGTTVVGGAIGHIVCELGSLVFNGTNSFEKAAIDGKETFTKCGQIFGNVHDVAKVNNIMSYVDAGTVVNYNTDKHALVLGTNVYELEIQDNNKVQLIK